MATIYEYTYGWDSGARTVASFAQDGEFSFSVGPTVGIVCGLNGQDQAVDYYEIQHGFYIDSRAYRIVESGTFRTLAATYSKSAIFKITRVEGVVRYYIDDVLVYTSVVRSSGTVFGDCSLYAYGDSIYDATLLDLYPDGKNYGDAPIGPVRAQGVQGDANWGAVGLGPLTVAAEVYDPSYGAVSIGPLWAKGAQGSPSFGGAGLGPLDAAGEEDALVPEYSVGRVDMGPMHAWGYEGVPDVNSGEIEVGSLWVRGSEDSNNWGTAELAPMGAFGYSTHHNYLIATAPRWSVISRQIDPLVTRIAVTLPAPLMQGTVEVRPCSIALTLPAPSLWMHGGDFIRLDLPALTVALTGAFSGGGTLSVELPALEVALTGVLGSTGTITIDLPALNFTGTGNEGIALTLPALDVTLTGVTGGTGAVEIALPALEVALTGLLGIAGDIVLEIPAPLATLEGLFGVAGAIAVSLPAPIVALAGTGVVTETTYAINLTTGAVTQLLLGAFDKLVTAHGKLYGLKDGDLHVLGGNDDDGTAITATIRFAPQQFGTLLAKRLDGAVYLNCRELNGLTLKLVQDEIATWTYRTLTDASPGMGTHKVKVGRGITFHSLGITVQNRDGGGLSIGGLEVPVYPLSRRPR